MLDLPSSLQPIGFLDVEVVEARNLPRIDIFGTADPYSPCPRPRFRRRIRLHFLPSHCAA